MQNFVFRNPTEILFGRGTIGGIESRVLTRVRARFAERKTVLGEHGDLGPDAVAAIVRSRA